MIASLAPFQISHPIFPIFSQRNLFFRLIYAKQVLAFRFCDLASSKSSNNSCASHKTKAHGTHTRNRTCNHPCLINITRLDFVALAFEALDMPTAKSGWGVARFVKFCKSYKLVGWMTGDPEFVDLEEIDHLPVNAIGSMGLLSHRFVSAEVGGGWGVECGGERERRMASGSLVIPPPPFFGTEL
jgi:hypothetical protein